MFNVMIIEDEALAANRLEMLIKRCDKDFNIISKLASIKATVQWFGEYTAPDLIFMDIHLEDGLSFAILEQIPIAVPIILTTAFDDEFVKSFKTRYFDYLLKPINKEDLALVLEKFKRLQESAG